VTISIGVATMAPNDADRSLDPLIEHADKALYYSKSAGRNRIFGWRDSLNERLRYA
jgi:PleD family two-component response regulator